MKRSGALFGAFTFIASSTKVHTTYEELSNVIYDSGVNCEYAGDSWYRAAPKTMFASHPDDAQFIPICLTNPFELDHMLSLPKRSSKRPYLVWSESFHIAMDNTSYDMCDEGCPNAESKAICLKLAQLVARGDMLFTSHDAREYATWNNQAKPLPGPTVIPPNPSGYFEAPSVLSSTKYLVSFQGKVSYHPESKTRQDLKQHFQANTSFKRPDVYVFVKQPGEAYPTREGTDYNEILKNSAYTLVPRGDLRWSYRFTEAISACSIPVVMADGLTLPFSQIIDWSYAAFTRPEGLARDPQALIDSLPQDAETINKMRQKVCELHNKFFSSEEKKAIALFRSAKFMADR